MFNFRSAAFFIVCSLFISQVAIAGHGGSVHSSPGAKDEFPFLTAEMVKQEMTGTNKPVLIDVGARQEYTGAHIPGAINIPAPDLRRRHAELPKGEPVVVLCSTGYRSSLAASILQRNGLKDVRNVAGGMTGYLAAGYAR